MNKTELVQVKVTKKQKEQLIKNAEKKDLKLTDYIREKLFNK
nr:MAG TPA: NikA, BACTERIAL CONJUGATION, RELAXASE, DNA [Caudoviricetes sp.]